MKPRNFKISSLAIAAALITLAFGDAARADWTLVTGDFAEQKGFTVNTWDIADGLSVTGESGKLSKVDSRNILSLTSSKPKAATIGGGAGWRMNLRNGDVLYGEPGAIKGQSIEFKMVEGGAILVPLKVVAGISRFKQNTGGILAVGAGPINEIAAPADTDVITMVNSGDSLKGLIVDVNAEKIQLAVGTINPVISTIDMSSVDHLTFGGVTSPRVLPPLSARLTFVSGSVLTLLLDAKTKSFSWSIGDITFKDSAGQDRKIAADMLTSVEVTGGRVVYLTEIDPSKDDQTTFMGTQWTTQINKNVLGQPLKVAKTTYARGLGVHTRSDVTYDLDGSFETLKFRVGMDDSAAPQGAADVSVVLDGKVIWESKGLRASAATVEGGKAGPQVSEEVSLPIKGGKKLELRADPTAGGGKIDVLGRVDWLNVALVRP